MLFQDERKGDYRLKKVMSAIPSLTQSASLNIFPRLVVHVYLRQFHEPPLPTLTDDILKLVLVLIMEVLST